MTINRIGYSLLRRAKSTLGSSILRPRRGALAPWTGMSSTDAAPPTKPPNVLVLTAGSRIHPEKRDAVFSSTKEGLAACLDGERYVVYRLDAEDVETAPWRDNCSLLVVPSGLQQEACSAGMLREMESYIQGGGTLLSMHRETNAAFRFQNPEDFLDSTVVGVKQHTTSKLEMRGENVEPEDYFVAQTCTPVKSSHESALTRFSASLTPQKSEVLASMERLKLNIDTMEVAKDEEEDKVCRVDGNEVPVVDCIRHVRFEGSPGQAVLSHIDLLPAAGSRELSVSELVVLKRDAERVAELLRAVLQGVGLECSKTKGSSPTLSYLICSDTLRTRFESAMTPLLKDDIIQGSETDIELVCTNMTTEGTPVDPLPSPAVNKIVLLTRPSAAQLQGVKFDTAQYMRCLRTGLLGRTLLYTPVIGSTQTMLTGNVPFCLALQTDMGVVCAAGQQTRGKGRRGNVWLSPEGCMMFSTPLTVQPWSTLHRRIPLLQHIVALSVASAVRTIPGYEALPVCVKWPNDIYYRDQVKLGGILVTSFAAGGSSAATTAVIGCGVNVCNKYPTMSINDCIQLYNGERGSSLPPLTVEALLALTLNRLEMYLGLYQGAGLGAIEREYYHYWLHSNAVVQLASQGNEEVTVTGIDEYGYLRVRTQSGEELKLQPDGNSFDIMKNLIVMK